MSAQELTKKVRELKELKVMAEELAAEITAIEDEIKTVMTAQGTDEITVDAFKIRWKTVETTRFDSTAFKNAYAELYGRFTKRTSCKRFTIA